MSEVILINITGSSKLGLHEVHEASTIIQKAADPEANIIFGAVLNDAMEDQVKITVIATGFRSENVGISKKMSDAAAASAAELRPAMQQAAAARHHEAGGSRQLSEQPGTDPPVVQPKEPELGTVVAPAARDRVRP